MTRVSINIYPYISFPLQSLQHAWIVLTDLHDICEGALYDLINNETGRKGERKTPICRASLEKMRSITAMITNDFGKEGKGQNQQKCDLISIQIIQRHLKEKTAELIKLLKIE